MLLRVCVSLLWGCVYVCPRCNYVVDVDVIWVGPLAHHVLSYLHRRPCASITSIHQLIYPDSPVNLASRPNAVGLASNIGAFGWVVMHASR